MRWKIPCQSACINARRGKQTISRYSMVLQKMLASKWHRYSIGCPRLNTRHPSEREEEERHMCLHHPSSNLTLDLLSLIHLAAARVRHRNICLLACRCNHLTWLLPVARHTNLNPIITHIRPRPSFRRNGMCLLRRFPRPSIYSMVMHSIVVICQIVSKTIVRRQIVDMDSFSI